MASKKTVVVGGRVPRNIETQMKQHNLKVPEAVQIALQTKANPQKLMEAELRSLLAEQEILANKLADTNLLIEKYMKRLNITKTVDELKQDIFVDDNKKAVQRTLERFESKRGESALTLDDYIVTKEGKRVIKQQLSKCDLTEPDFMTMLYELHDKSFQTKLDS